MAHMTGQLRVLTLNKDENLETKLFRLEKGWTLHFVLGPSLADKNVRVFVNHPEKSKTGSSRYAYRELAWNNYSASKFDVHDNYCIVGIVLAGSFNYYFTIDGSEKHVNGRGYFLVDPQLTIGRYDERLSLDSVCCQTVLSKLLGPMDEWRARLQVARQSGYNMVHFTPLQPLGKSSSAYCLADQNALNPKFSRPNKTYGWEDVGRLVDTMAREWEVLSVTDLVLNHTANESPWLQAHPECAYQLVTAPHLKPAYLLDRMLWQLTLDVGEELYEEKGLPAAIRTEAHLKILRALLCDDLIPKLKIHEFYTLPIDDIMLQFRAAIKGIQVDDTEDVPENLGIQVEGTEAVPENLDRQSGENQAGKKVTIIPDPEMRRLKSTIDLPLALHLFNTPKPDAVSEDQRVEWCCAALQYHLKQLNTAACATVRSHMAAAVTNVIANARWRFVDKGGEQLKKVTVKAPIMFNYFTFPEKEERISMEREEARMYSDDAAFCMAHNGWVMGDDPLKNFAEPGSNVYLRRELIPWGDSVKLRYGASSDDCPYLWNHMRQYAVQTAKLFHGVRLDNCHSTPIHVAEYLLDEARKVRPDLYVFAELFTSSERKDNIFINRLGLTSLIREALSAWDSHEQGRLVHRYGGFPVGAFIQPPARPLVASRAHAIFYDQTHDNLSPVEKRSVYDLLPSAALVAMTCSATGSNRGYDEMVPHHIHVVKESRLYSSWAEKSGGPIVNARTGLIASKRALNKLHQHIGCAGFNQVYVDQVTPNVVSVTRHNSVSHQSIILIAHTAFTHPNGKDTHVIKPMTIPGNIDEIWLEARTEHRRKEEYVKDKTYINGLPGYGTVLREHVKISDSTMVKIKKDKEGNQQLEFSNFPPGSIIVLKVSLLTSIKAAILTVRSCLSSFGYRVHTYSGRNMKEISSTELEGILSRLTLSDINRVMYRCAAEEVDDGFGGGAYEIPGYGHLVYCGLQGVMSILSDIRAADDLGHPLCANLRAGDWLMDYITNRLKPYPSTAKLSAWFEKTFAGVKQMPRYLVPCYFDAVITGVHMAVEEVAWSKMSEFVRNGSEFVRRLSAGSLQFCSVVKSAPLPNLSPNLASPKPPIVIDEKSHRRVQACISLAAGLPHFTSGIMRNWGRDTFIALNGLLLIPGRYDDARFLILAFASTLRHGLIPNLLGGGISARYNGRDAVWWWLYCIQEYVRIVPNGRVLLKDKVSRLYQFDDDMPLVAGQVDQRLEEVVQEALQRHADGLQFRERNAGPGIDKEMSSAGFNIDIGIDWKTGFPYGGNIHNCGTWMDKMGSSDEANNKGIPATPRDGRAVELVGLCMSTVLWLADMHAAGYYGYEGVIATIEGQSKECTFAQWATLIQENFEKCFWVPPTPADGDSKFVNRRGMYKDSYGASQPWADFQLRPNFCVAMVVAPQLFTPERAWTALTLAGEVLLGPLGMRTLDPTDWAYNGNYINSDATHGFNYHQGPEWVWPVGYFLRAQLAMAGRLEETRPGLLGRTVTNIKGVLSAHNVALRSGPWKSLPELTNKDGTICKDSCPAQAWSMASILEVLYDLQQLTVKSK